MLDEVLQIFVADWIKLCHCIHERKENLPVSDVETMTASQVLVERRSGSTDTGGVVSLSPVQNKVLLSLAMMSDKEDFFVQEYHRAEKQIFSCSSHRVSTIAEVKMV